MLDLERRWRTGLVSGTHGTCIESTNDSTPAAMVLRVEARIAILKPPAVGKEVRWIAISIVRCGSLLRYEESLLVIDWRNHDMMNSADLQLLE